MVAEILEKAARDSTATMVCFVFCAYSSFSPIPFLLRKIRTKVHPVAVETLECFVVVDVAGRLAREIVATKDTAKIMAGRKIW